MKRERHTEKERALSERKERLQIDYSSIKPSGRLSRSGYLFGHGLGVWLKLRLRADNLPLFSAGENLQTTDG
jgi:hypothetical protein